MKNVDCAKFELLIAARENGSIDSDAGARLDAHLLICAACTSLVLTTPPAGGDPTPSSTTSNGAFVLGREIARGGMGRIMAAESWPPKTCASAAGLP
jgi:hypothetical protein